MTTTPVEGTGSPLSGLFGTPAATGDAGPTVSTSTSADKDMFLQLLVAQMRYQDPANPTSSAEFLAQSAQFTSLEKMQQVADQTSELVALQVAFGASSMVGRTITYPGSAEGETVSGVVESVTFGATGPVLRVNGEDIYLAEVLSVGTPTGSAPTERATAPGATTPVVAGSGTGFGLNPGSDLDLDPSTPL